MDTIVGIFEQLGANSSVLYQFLIFVVVFLVSRFGFFGHLQKILDLREERTTKLEGSAEAKLDEVNKLVSEYKMKIIDANRSAKNELDEAKKSIVKEEELRYRAEEEQVSKYIESARVEFHKELEGKKAEIMKEAQGLANTLVAKVTKG